MTNNLETDSNEFQFGDWEFNVDDNSIKNLQSHHVERLEPKVGDLLRVLLNANHEVVSKKTLMAELWPTVVVGDDTLAKTVSRLRSALGEKASCADLIETIPKRGYRLKKSRPASTKGRDTFVENQQRVVNIRWALTFIGVVGSTFALWFWGLAVHNSDQLEEKLNRADSLYMKFDEQSNEAALALYEDILETEQANTHAQAGVVNAMVQRVVRWPEGEPEQGSNGPSIRSALASGQLSTPEAKLMLERARLMAERAVRESPKSTQALKALGFVYSAEGKLDRAIEQYQRAISVDGGEWRSMINLGELFNLTKQPEAALKMFTRAYFAMQSNYAKEAQYIGPWQPSLGVVIAQMHQQLGDQENALSWAEKVLELEPFERNASSIYLNAAVAMGKVERVTLFCESYATKLDLPRVCKELLQ